MAAPMVDEALADLLKAEQKAAKARSSPPVTEEDGRKKKRRRDVDKDADEAYQVALLWHLLLPSSTALSSHSMSHGWVVGSLVVCECPCGLKG